MPTVAVATQHAEADSATPDALSPEQYPSSLRQVQKATEKKGTRESAATPEMSEMSPELIAARAKLVRSNLSSSPPSHEKSVESDVPGSPFHFGVILRTTPRSTPRGSVSRSNSGEGVVLKSAQETWMQPKSELPIWARQAQNPKHVKDRQTASSPKVNKPPLSNPPTVAKLSRERSPDSKTATQPMKHSWGLEATAGCTEASCTQHDSLSPSLGDCSSLNRKASLRRESVRNLEISQLVSSNSIVSRQSSEEYATDVNAEVVVAPHMWNIQSKDADSLGGKVQKIDTGSLLRAQQNASQLQTLQHTTESRNKQRSPKGDRPGSAVSSENVAALEARLESVENERDSLHRAVMQLEEALRMRNEEVKALVTRTQELETSIVHGLQPSPRAMMPKWEERLMRRDSSPFMKTKSVESSLDQPLGWECDVAGQWITAMAQTIQAVESLVQETSRTFQLKLQGEVSYSRQIQMLNARLQELDRHHKRREHDMNQMLVDCEFLGRAHARVLEHDLHEARKTVQLSESSYSVLESVLQKLQQKFTHENSNRDAIVDAMEACAVDARGVAGQKGTLAVLDQSGRALASAWMAIQERDIKLHVVQAMVTKANSYKNSDFMSMKSKEAEVQQLKALVQEKEDLLRVWMQRYEIEIENIRTKQRVTEAALRDEVCSLKGNMAFLVSFYLKRQEQLHEMNQMQSEPKHQDSICQSISDSRNANITRVSLPFTSPSPGRGARALNMLSNALKVRSTSAPSSRHPSTFLHSSDTTTTTAPAEAAAPCADLPAMSQQAADVEALRQINLQLASMLQSRTPPKQSAQFDEPHEHQRFVEDTLNADQIQHRCSLAIFADARSLTATEPRPTLMRPLVSSSPRRTMPQRGVD